MSEPWQTLAEVVFSRMVGDDPNATYHPATGDPIDCRLYVTGLNVQRQNYPEYWTAAMTGQVLASEVGQDIKIGETLDFDSKAYVIAEDPFSNDGVTWDLTLNKF